MKTLMTKTTHDGDVDTEEFLVGLLEWRNTPRQDGLSPAEILLGHPMRTSWFPHIVHGLIVAGRRWTYSGINAEA